MRYVFPLLDCDSTRNSIVESSSKDSVRKLCEAETHHLRGTTISLEVGNAKCQVVQALIAS
jgi:hypothetical protein